MGDTPTAQSLPDIEEVFGPGGRLEACLALFEHRPQQIEAAQAISEAISERRCCLVEAGTGVGKTLAYLVPVARALANGATAVISTYTINLQTQLIEKDIPLLSALLPEVPVRPCLLKGKGNYLCKQDLEAACGDLFHIGEPTFERVRKWAGRTRSGDVAELPFAYPRWHEIAANQDTCRLSNCRFFDSCHYYRARRFAMTCNLVVVNHALLLTDLVARETGEEGAGLLPDYDVLVLDEAHHVEDAATSALSVSLADWEVPAFTERLRRTPGFTDTGGLLPAVDQTCEALFALLRGSRMDFTIRDRLDMDAAAAMADAGARLRTALTQVQTSLNERLNDAEDSERERLEGLNQTAMRLAAAAGQVVVAPEPGRLQWCQMLGQVRHASRSGRTSDTRLVIHNTPIEVGDLLSRTLWSRMPHPILTSATLATSGGFAYLRSRLGIEVPASERMIGSPFDFRSQAMLYVPAHLPPPPKQFDESYVELLMVEIRRIIELTAGRAFLLFTSRMALNEAHRRLKDDCPFPLFRQGDLPPQKLLKAYRESGNGVLLGNQTFWEGVDVQGSALSAVVIDRIPFAVPDSPINKARTDAIVAAGRDWFAEFSLPQAQIRLKQGFGRLIRTRSDRGIVCVLDSRLANRSYGRLFIENLPPAARASTWSRVERFWNS